jgi:type VI secretion system secreted protein VgrG
VYYFQSSAQLTGVLTLNTLNDPNAQFVFQIGSALTTASNSVVDVLNAGSDTSVYWQVGSSATLGTATRFAGNILADQSITMNTASTILCGRALALTAALTLDTNTIAIGCPQDIVDDDGGGGGGTVPEPGSLWLAGIGLCALGAGRVRRALRPRARRRAQVRP